jgi:hypothetical protein
LKSQFQALELQRRTIRLQRDQQRLLSMKKRRLRKKTRLLREKEKVLYADELSVIDEMIRIEQKKADDSEIVQSPGSGAIPLQTSVDFSSA